MRKLLVAAFLIGLLFNQLYAETPEEMSRLFQRGVERLQADKEKIFGNRPVDITYDVKKTDSVIQPIIGVLRIKQHLVVEYHFDQVFDINFFFHDGAWTINSITVKTVDETGMDVAANQKTVESYKMQIEKYFTAQ